MGKFGRNRTNIQPPSSLTREVRKKTVVHEPVYSAEEFTLLAKDKKSFTVRAGLLFDRCDFFRESFDGNPIQLEEDSRLVEKMLSLLEDVNGIRLTDEQGNLRKGLESTLVSLLALADRWRAKQVRDHLSVIFVENFDKLYRFYSRRGGNLFEGISCLGIKVLVMPLLSRVSDRCVLESILFQMRSSCENRCRQEMHVLRKVFDLIEDRIDEL